MLKISSEFHNTRLGGRSHELHDFKNDFSTQFSDLSNSLNKKKYSMCKLLGEFEGITESLMGVRDSIIEAFKA